MECATNNVSLAGIESERFTIRFSHARYERLLLACAIHTSRRTENYCPQCRRQHYRRSYPRKIKNTIGNYGNHLICHNFSSAWIIRSIELPSNEILTHNFPNQLRLRLWGEHGQALLEAAQLCLINVSALGTEILKNIVLPGIGGFTIVDSGVVTEENVGCK